MNTTNSPAAHPTDGGPAFPVPMIPCGRDGDYTSVELQGMSLRDYFAATSMAAYRNQSFDSQPKDVARWAYLDADAMLAAREAKR